MVYPLQGVSSPGVIFLPFLFYPNGTSVSALVVAPAFASTSTSNAFIASVIRTSTAGQFTITLRDSYVQYLGGNAQIHLNTPATDLKCIFDLVDVVTNKTVRLNILAVATPTDITGNANSYIAVQLYLGNSAINF